MRFGVANRLKTFSFVGVNGLRIGVLGSSSASGFTFTFVFDAYDAYAYGEPKTR